MKKQLLYITICGLLVCFGCKEEEVILSKPGEAIEPVTNLDYSITGDNVNLTWELPATFPDDIIEPVSVQVKILANGQNAGTIILEDNPMSFIYTSYDASNEYRFTVKVMASVDTDDPAVSDLRYSLGKTVVL